jgi:predicted phage terminase large subunit-like protein
MFKVDQIAVVDVMPPPEQILKVVRYWDKAGTAEWLKGKSGMKKNEGARTAGVKICSLKNGKYIVMNSIKGRWEAQERESKILNTAVADGDRVDIWIEQEPGSGGKESAQATIRMLAGFHCEAERPVGDKAYRADPFSVQVNNGNVMILRGDWNKDFLNELEGFPFGKLKDQVDAGGAGFSKLRAKKKVKSYN